MREPETKLPEGLEFWTADEVAECLDFEDPGRELYSKLWRILSEAENPTPLGGDGTDGTVETPDDRLDPDNDDKAPHWWDKLTEDERRRIVDAFEAENDFREEQGEPKDAPPSVM